MAFFIIGIGAYIAHFLSKLVCECCIRICSLTIFYSYNFSQLDTTPLFQGEKHKVGLQIQSVTLFAIFFYGAICSFTFPSKNTLQCTHIIHNTLLYILENTNQNKVSESDHAVT